jgi:hypothetical protein
MSFTTSDKPKKQIPEITNEYKPFWSPVFEDLGIKNPTFYAKLCYMGKEFSNDANSRDECVRFFPRELSTGGDVYVELFDWDQNHYDSAYRTLYKLPFDGDWKSKTSDYAEIKNDKLTTSTYAVKLTKLQVVNRTDIKASVPQMTKKSLIDLPFMNEDPFNEQLFDETYSEKEDVHTSGMTMRDLYCIMQNVPMSNKKWLNKLIEKGTKWQQQK